METTKEFLLSPLRKFYFHGPSFLGLGGWEGIPAEDICAHITKVSSSLWKYSALSNCIVLLENKFQAYLIGVYAFIYVWLICKLFNYAWMRYMIIGPILKELKNYDQKSK